MLNIKVGSVMRDVLVLRVEATLVTDILHISSSQSLDTRPAPALSKCSSSMKKPSTAFK